MRASRRIYQWVFDNLEKAPNVKVPTLIVAGSIDVPHVLGVARRLKEGIEGSRLEMIEGTAHLPTLEVPTKWQSLLAEFLKSK